MLQKAKEFVSTNKMGLIVGVVVGVLGFWGFQKFKNRGTKRR